MHTQPWEIVMVGGRLALWVSRGYFLQMVGKRFRPDEPLRFKWLGAADQFHENEMAAFKVEFPSARVIRKQHREHRFIHEFVMNVSEPDLVMMKMRSKFISGTDHSDPTMTFFEDDPPTIGEKIRDKLSQWLAPIRRFFA